MRNKGLQLAAVLVAAVSLVACSSMTPLSQPPMNTAIENTQDLLQLPDRSRISMSLRGQMLNVEVVNSSASITQGLSGRSQIGADGMLFVLPQSRIPNFWMKDMQFDLDFVWLLENQVIDITEKVPSPAPNTPDNYLPLYQPNQAVNLVLELPAGTVDALGIKIGDQAQW